MYDELNNVILPIKILEYNPENGLIEFIDQVTNYKALRFASDWEGVGSFTVEMNADKGKAAEFQVGRIIQLGNDINRQGLIMKITRRMAKAVDGHLTNEILVSGLQLKGILAFSVTVPPGGEWAGGDPETGIWQWYDVNGNLVDITTLDYSGTGISYDVYEEQYTETIMKDLVYNNRKVNLIPFQNTPNLEIETDDQRGVFHEIESFRFKKLSDSLEYLSQASGLGWNIVAEDGKLVFKVFEGVDRSAEQSVNNNVVFAFDRGNLSRVEYTEDTIEMNNQIILGGQGEGDNRDFLVMGDFAQTGVLSQLGFVDARDVETLEGLETRGLQKIVDRSRKQAISVTGFSKKILVQLGVDYNIGDIVTVNISEWGLILHVRVISLVERQTLNNAGTIEFEFGTKTLSLESLVRQSFENTDNETLR